MDIREGILWYLVFLFSTVYHEAAHAFTAWKLGDSTGYQGGQVTLNPASHIQREPVGMVVIPLISLLTAGWLMGWASTPYNVFWARTYPKRAALMALAGPVANLSLVLLSAVLIRIGLSTGIFMMPSALNFSLAHLVQASSNVFVGVGMALSICFSLNLLLCIFNLLPVPPLDGSGILPLFLSRQNALRYMDTIQHQPVFMIVGILLAWNLFPYIFRPIFQVSLSLIYWGA